MNSDRKANYLFKIWLILYRLENFIWQRYAYSFMKLNGGKAFHEYHQNQSVNDEVPF